MATVFLSYAREDVARLSPLAAALEQAGHIVWWDEHIRGGDQFAEAIEQALNAADVIVVAWTEASTHSAWVRDEAATGRDSGRLVPVTLDGCPPPLGFRQYQTIDLSRWNGRANSRHFERLEHAVATKAAAPGDEQPTRKPPRLRAPRFGRSQGLAAAATLLALIVAAVLLYPKLPFGGSGRVTPKVVLAEFKVITPGLRRELSQAMYEEILAAFGAEHEVSVITAGPGRLRSAPFLLDGSVQKSADALHFTVNLKNQRTGGLVWSQAFDRALVDMLAPRQVAVAASQVVRCGLWGASAYRKPMSDRALSLYLQWCNEYWGGSPDEDRILDAGRAITAALPDFSFGWSALALATVPISHRAGAADTAAIRREGWQAAQNSIRLDRLNPEGYMAMAGLLPMTRFAEREQLLTRAISVRPTECGCERQSYGDFLTSVGRLEEAVAEYDRARAMMPLAPMSNVRLAQSLHLVGRHTEADRIISRMLEIWPDAETLRLLQVKAALWTGRYAEAVPLLRQPELHLADAERNALVHAFEALASKDGDQAARATAELVALARDPRRIDRLIVGALAALRAETEALEAADDLIRARGPALADVLFEPNLAAARDSPQYAALVTRLGLAGYWRSARRLPDICGGTTNLAFCTPQGRASQ
jgi:tetratricopeptide (TPR) repeat protein